jgi:predicted dehydrogenase
MLMNRRDFFKTGAAAGIASAPGGQSSAAGAQDHSRIGFIGVGGRGSGLLNNILQVPSVQIRAICDIRPDNLAKAQAAVEKSGRERPAGYSKNEYSYLDLVARDDLDGVIIATPWQWHIRMAIAAMKAGKYAGMEVAPASSVEECWDLVKAHEDTGVPCMFLENCCYRRFAMAILNMVRKGIFGELVHCQCGYQHDLRQRIVMGKNTGVPVEGGGDFRTLYNRIRNGDLYPTHGIGPIANCLNIDRGNRFASLTSTATKSRGLHSWAVDNLPKDDPHTKIQWAHGDVITTVIKCQNGETVIVNHDTNLPRPYSNMYRVQGTKGLWMEDNHSIYIEGRSKPHQWERFDKYQEEFEHPLWKNYLRQGIQKGHSGIDFLEVRAFAEVSRRKLPPPIDVYDAASWMAISPLSERSIAMGSAPVPFPDFTNGKWMFNKPIFGLTSEY